MAVRWGVLAERSSGLEVFLCGMKVGERVFAINARGGGDVAKGVRVGRGAMCIERKRGSTWSCSPFQGERLLTNLALLSG
jgi:hypothetical protein